MAAVALDDAALPARCKYSASTRSCDETFDAQVFSDGPQAADGDSTRRQSSIAADELAQALDDTALWAAPPASVHQAFLTANDIVNPAEHELLDVHERSQDALAQVFHHRNIHTQARVPFITEAAANNSSLLRERAAAIELLNGVQHSGIHGVHMVRIMLHNMDASKTGTCSVNTFAGAFANLGVRMTPKQFEYVQDLFPAVGKPHSFVDYARLLAHGYSNWSKTREDAVREAFESLSSRGLGSIMTLEHITRHFHPEALNSSLVPDVDQQEQHSFNIFQSQWNLSATGADGVVTWLDFIDYYLDVSTSVASDKAFCCFVCQSWGINVDDWLAKQLFQRYSGGGREEDSLQVQDFVDMLRTLDPTITVDEGLAWFRSIDEDGSGEVSLEEFLECQVLKVKRLFDVFDVDSQRTVTEEQMVEILRSLNGTIEEAEAIALYRYADLDGNGDVSFTEFLENRLLQMLKIFDSFNGGVHTRCITAAQTESFFKRLDNTLTDADAHALYKAVDIEKTGAVSFVHLVESQVLRAKVLFERYDISGQRALTLIQFRELMHTLDPGLTEEELDAIYRLVRDASDGKVRFASFLNPNIVKLKLLYDKYDKGRKRLLNVEQLRTMLREVFPILSERDLQEMEKVVPWAAERGLSLRDYVRHFEDLARSYEVLRLARRRREKEKAKRVAGMRR
mmetsp:Transcript_63190/g.150686  ORF Transcript_63190/g.150686 Transcript_63190/m.150686 type:complete len:682 (-) Transcript_63190:151-2196(-)